MNNTDKEQQEQMCDTPNFESELEKAVSEKMRDVPNFEAELREAATKGDLNKAKSLLKDGAQIDAQDSDYGRTALHWAVSKGHLLMVRFLVENRANMEIKSTNETTPLYDAVYYNHLSILKYLVENGADVNAQEKGGWSILIRAVNSKNVEMVEFLVDKGANLKLRAQDGETALKFAIKYNLEKIKNYLAKKLGTSNLEELLVEAAKNGELKQVKSLLELGVCIDASDSDQWTALHHAASRPSFELVKYLVENGAKLRIKNNDKNTPLKIAQDFSQKDKDYTKTVDFLVSEEKNLINSDIILEGNGFASKYQNIQRRIQRRCELQATEFYVHTTQEIIVNVESEPDDKVYAVVGIYQLNSDLKKYPLSKGLNKFVPKNEGLLSFINNKNTPIKINLTTEFKLQRIPSFKLHETTNAEWKKRMELYSNAPIVQLSSERATIVVRYKSALKHLKDPTQLMQYYDKFIRLQDAVSGEQEGGKKDYKSDPNKFLYVEADSGYMFATHDRMGFNGERALNRLLTPDKEAWGVWHESGHQRQQSPYKWSEMGEVTVNLYSLAVEEGLFGTDKNLYGQQMLTTSYPKEYLYGTEKNFDNLDNWTKLVFLWQLKQTFGKQFYQKLHQAYRLMGVDTLPETDDEKKQQFIITSSKVTHLNLAPFFRKWGIDPNGKTLEIINKLPPLKQNIWENDNKKSITIDIPGYDPELAYQNKNLSITNESLLLAAEFGDDREVKEHLAAGADINFTNKAKQSALFCATRGSRDRLEIVRFLVKQGAKLDVKDTSGWTLLHRAVESRQVEVVKFLVERGADLEAKTNYGNTPFDFTQEDGRANSLENSQQRKEWVAMEAYLIEKTSDKSKFLLIAAEDGNLRLVKQLIDAGIPVDSRNNNRQTALFCAARGGRVEVMRYLVENGADINAKDNGGWSILHRAVESRQLEVVKFLVDRGADLEAKTNYGNTPFDFTQEDGRANSLENSQQQKEWVAIEAYLKERTPDKSKLLTIAAEGDNLRLVKKLIDEGAQAVNHQVSANTSTENDQTNVTTLLGSASTIKEKTPSFLQSRVGFHQAEPRNASSYDQTNKTDRIDQVELSITLKFNR